MSFCLAPAELLWLMVKAYVFIITINEKKGL